MRVRIHRCFFITVSRKMRFIISIWTACSFTSRKINIRKWSIQTTFFFFDVVFLAAQYASWWHYASCAARAMLINCLCFIATLTLSNLATIRALPDTREYLDTNNFYKLGSTSLKLVIINRNVGTIVYCFVISLRLFIIKSRNIQADREFLKY